MRALTVALWHAAMLANFDSDPSEAEHFASDLIELATRQSIAQFLAGGEVFRGWARGISGNTTEGLAAAPTTQFV
jgi:hypothetical protein